MKDIKHLWKFFVLGFVISFLFFNWSEVLIFSNYQVVWHNIKTFFGIEEQAAPQKVLISQHITEVKEEASESLEPKPKIPEKTESNMIRIPKINVLAPIILSGNNSLESSKNALKQGVLLYSLGAMPGEPGKTYILGHSAPEGWPDIYFDNVFNEINGLGPGDAIFIDFIGKSYEYIVFDQKIFLPKNEDAGLAIQKQSDSFLILLTCWPRGKDFQRLAVFAELVDKN